jgi:hypothetical protein
MPEDNTEIQVPGAATTPVVSVGKSALTSKLNWLGFLLAGVGLLEMVQGTGLNFIPEKWRPVAVSGLGLLIMALRTFGTSQPITGVVRKSNGTA